MPAIHYSLSVGPKMQGDGVFIARAIGTSDELSKERLVAVAQRADADLRIFVTAPQEVAALRATLLKLRSEGCASVILVVAPDLTSDEILSLLALGAHDFIGLPTTQAEVVARVQR